MVLFGESAARDPILRRMRRPTSLVFSTYRCDKTLITSPFRSRNLTPGCFPDLASGSPLGLSAVENLSGARMTAAQPCLHGRQYEVPVASVWPSLRIRLFEGAKPTGILAVPLCKRLKSLTGCLKTNTAHVRLSVQGIGSMWSCMRVVCSATLPGSPLQRPKSESC